MNTRCVVLDIGGVLEITPATGWQGGWEQRLGLPPGEVDRLLAGVWRAGSTGALSEEGVRTRVSALLGLDAARTDAFMADLWHEYLGSPNEELISYVRDLPSRWRHCRLGILSNSFAGAREREEVKYRFGEFMDDIVYSHETGILKPDPRAYRAVCSRLGARPEDCLFVDDDPAHAAAAREIGMEAHLFEDNLRAMVRIAGHMAAVPGRR
ncbi:HAD-IA family hydrolase [Streptomyces sp. NPDC004609]|uniref:HAD-IA family hydrolase n=1 Tax=Streptomyces sp. NPDC004609 TaxID=3364704 RepID=UPI0036B3C1D1